MNEHGYNTQDWSYIKNELMEVDKLLTKEIDVYLIGGSALSFYGIKDATKDIDVLFENQYDCAEFFNAVIKLGYETSEQYFPPLIQMEATFFVYKDDEIWIDLFVKNVMNKFELTKSIKFRSVQTDLPTTKLTVNCLDENDIFLCQIALRVPLISAHCVRSNGWHVHLPPVGSTLSAQAI